MGRREKTGSDFEKLVAWIQECTHKKAQVTFNKKIRDVDTGRVRQIDIYLELADGPSKFSAIVEARKRSRKVDVRYVEEVVSKIKSVKADAGFIVSNAGFTEPAKIKADRFNIRIFTYEEAQNYQWDGWIRSNKFRVFYNKYDNPKISFFNYKTKEIIIPSDKVLENFNENPERKVIVDESFQPVCTLSSIINKIISLFGNEPFEEIYNTEQRIKKRFHFNGKFKPKIYIESSKGYFERIGEIIIEATLFIECKEFPMKLNKYKDPNKDEQDYSIAEIASSNIEIFGEKYKVELLAKPDGNVLPAGSDVFLRKTKIDEH